VLGDAGAQQRLRLLGVVAQLVAEEVVVGAVLEPAAALEEAEAQLRERQRLARHPGQLGADLIDLGVELIVGDHPVDQPGLQGGARVEPLAQPEHLLGPARRELPGDGRDLDVVGALVAGHPRGELGALAGDHEVGCRDQHQRRRHAVAVDPGDGRHRQLAQQLDRAHEQLRLLPEAPLHAFQVLAVALVDDRRGEVVAGAERAPGAAEHDDADVLAVAGLQQRPFELAQQLRALGVVGAGTVEGEVAHLSPVLDQDGRLCTHRSLLLRMYAAPTASAFRPSPPSRYWAASTRR
jgi:hypothetical protein